MTDLLLVDRYLETALEICSEGGRASLNLTTGERRLCLLWAHWMHDREQANDLPSGGYSMGTGLDVLRRAMADVREATATIDLRNRIVYYGHCLTGKATKLSV
jgi:hypothetical protein